MTLVVSRLSGGLGNQLFQYAAACGIAHQARSRVVLDVSSFDEVHDGRSYLLERYVPAGIVVSGTAFDPTWRTAAIKAAAAAAAAPLPVYRENNYEFEPGAMALRGSVYLYGFWQSWRYFEPVAGMLRARILGASASPGQTHATPDGEAVAVHVRRGDYLVPDVLEAFGLCEAAYYRAAMALMRARLVRPRFLVFSEDPRWCAEHLGDRDVTIVSRPGGDVHADLAAMARCRHHIIANSSLGWWGAWLASREDSIVIAPIPWYTQSTHAQDLIPPHWVRLDRRTGADWGAERRRPAAEKVSIVILARADADALARALGDAQAQSHAETEIVIALDDPHPAVAEAAKQAAHTSSTIRLVMAPTRGAACNAALALACGDWIAFLAEGDRWRCDKLRIQVEAACLDAVDLVGCRTVPIAGPDGMPEIFPPPGPPDCALPALLARGHAIAGWSHAIVRRGTLAASGAFDAEPRQDHDIALWRRLGLARAGGARNVILWDRLAMSPVAFLRPPRNGG